MQTWKGAGAAAGVDRCSMEKRGGGAAERSTDGIWREGGGGTKVKMSVRMEVSGTSVGSVEGGRQLTVTFGPGFVCACRIPLY